MNSMRTLLLLAALAGSLSGCFPLAVVGVGTTALVAADRRPGETQFTDQMIETRSSGRLNEKFGDKAHINVTSYDRTVLLTGEVLDAAAKGEAERIVGGVPNVKAITNELQIAGMSSFGSRSNDTLISTKVKARFIDSKQFAANHVKVVTEASVVFLLGMVTHKEADAAADIARTTGGVKSVVRAFEYISEEQAREIDNTPQKSGTSGTAGDHP